MATSSFGQKFYVSADNIDEFVSTVTKKDENITKHKFVSKAISKDKLKRLIRESVKSK